MDFSVIDRAGVTQGQFAAIIGVERVTVNTWVRAKFRPRGAMRSRVARLLDLLAEAVEAGKLPIPVPDRRAATDAVLASLRAALDTTGA